MGRIGLSVPPRCCCAAAAGLFWLLNASALGEQKIAEFEETRD
jgi:hypothetical protein